MPDFQVFWDVTSGTDGYTIRSGLVSGSYTNIQHIPGGNNSTGIITLPSAGPWYTVVNGYTGTPPSEVPGGYSQEFLLELLSPVGIFEVGVR